MNSGVLDRRRRELEMSVSALSARSGVPEATVKRILGGGLSKAAFSSVVAVAHALGIELDFKPKTDSIRFQEKQAEEKARFLVGVVQGSCGLEAQAVGSRDVEAMIRRTVHELMAGPKRRLWAR